MRGWLAAQGAVATENNRTMHTGVVPKGAARAVAEALAEEIAAFPQGCLRADRRSACEQWGLTEPEALRGEYARGFGVLESGESAAGAARFTGGAGRGGRPA